MVHKKKHRDIRVRVVNLVINNWKMYKKIVVGDPVPSVTCALRTLVLSKLKYFIILARW
jgi:hypothetical protein